MHVCDEWDEIRGNAIEKRGGVVAAGRKKRRRNGQIRAGARDGTLDGDGAVAGL